MKKQPNLQTRREFLRTSMVGGALTWTVPAFLHATMQQLHAATADSLTQAVTGKDGPILVVLQLSGGNDGLNTVVPLGNDDYHQARPQLGLDAKACLKLDDATGLHPALKGVKTLYDEGHAAIVQAVGYPNPNRSHFRSMEIWHTASDADQVSRHGWIGRYFDNACQGEDAGVGIAIGQETPQAFSAGKPLGVTFQRPEQYRYFGPEGESELVMAENALFRRMNDLDEGASGSSIGGLSGSQRKAQGASPLGFLERTALDAQVTSDRINDLAGVKSNRADYPTSRLGNDLRTVSRLIAGGMPTRIYYVSLGGFDTHTNQAATHQRLLGEFGDAVAAFLKDMAEQGNRDRVMLLTFSEFGRRVKQNASGGTDHGAGAPLFVFGGGVKPGVHGEAPSLKPDDLFRGDVVHRVDFRSVYATLLDGHLGADSQAVLGRRFPRLDLV